MAWKNVHTLCDNDEKHKPTGDSNNGRTGGGNGGRSRSVEQRFTEGSFVAAFALEHRL